MDPGLWTCQNNLPADRFDIAAKLPERTKESEPPENNSEDERPPVPAGPPARDKDGYPVLPADRNGIRPAGPRRNSIRDRR